MPTDEASPMITAPVSPHDLNRALKRDSITCNNDICNSPSTCAGPIGNTAACCYPGDNCTVATTCYSYGDVFLDSTGVLTDTGGLSCTDSSYPYCNTYVYAAYSGLNIIYCDYISTTNNQVILTGTYDWADQITIFGSSTVTQYSTIVSYVSSLTPQTSTASPTPTSSSAVTIGKHEVLSTGVVIGIAVGATLLGVAIIIIALLLWRRRSTTTNLQHQPPNPETQVASYASPSTDPHTSWAPVAIGGEKSPAYGYDARRIGLQPDCDGQKGGGGETEGINAPPVWAPPGEEMSNETTPAVISELGGESRSEGNVMGK